MKTITLRGIIIILSLLVLLAAAVSGYFFYLSFNKSTTEASHNNAEEQTEKVAAHIDTIILENQKSIKALAGHNSISKALTGKDSGSISEANSALALFRQSIDADVCYLMDSEGNTVASSNRDDADSFIGINFAFRPYFQKAIFGNKSVYMALGVTSGKRGIYFGYPVYAENKTRPAGVAVIKISADRISRILESSYDGIMTVTDPHGLIFISSDDSLLYKTLWPLSEDIKNELAVSRQFGKGPWDWTGIEIKGHEHGVNKPGIGHHIHSRKIQRYSGWEAVYLHENEASTARISGSMVRAIWLIAVILTLIMASVFMLYKKASDEIAARKVLENKLRDMSITDQLTGLYNRRGFFEFARHQYHTAARNKNHMTLFYLDIDDMKTINDKFGHKMGDNALIEVAGILKTTFRKSDILARLGGDEFAVLMIQTADHMSENIARRIENTIYIYNRIGKRPYILSVSIGETTCDPEKAVDFEALIQMANNSMYEKKKKKKADRDD